MPVSLPLVLSNPSRFSSLLSEVQANMTAAFEMTMVPMIISSGPFSMNEKKVISVVHQGIPTQK